MARIGHVLGILLVAATPVWADDAPAGGSEPGAEPKLIPAGGAPAVAPVPPAPPETAAMFSHKHQFGLSLRMALGLRAIATYKDTAYCGKQDLTTSTHNAPVCTGREPFSFDFEVSYGIARKLDAIIEARFAVESDFAPSIANQTSGPHPVKFAPGMRFFYSEGVHSKLFSTAQLVFDFTGYKDAMGASRGNDVGVRNLNGFWYDFTHDYGAYVYVGESATFARWFDIELEIGAGFQARFGH